jgi:hypothetical protein
MINCNHQCKAPLFQVNQVYLTSHMTFNMTKKNLNFEKEYRTNVIHYRIVKECYYRRNWLLLRDNHGLIYT